MKLIYSWHFKDRYKKNPQGCVLKSNNRILSVNIEDIYLRPTTKWGQNLVISYKLIMLFKF